MDQKHIFSDEGGIHYSSVNSKYDYDGFLIINPNFAADYYFPGDRMVWLLYPDGTNGLAESPEQIHEHKRRGGSFGMREKDFNRVGWTGKTYFGVYDIYQVKNGEDYHDIRFLNYSDLGDEGKNPNLAGYDHVYRGQLTRDDTLDKLYERFNIDHPEDYRGRSMSVSDIVAICLNQQQRLYYVDSFGFVDVTDTLRSKDKLMELPEDMKPQVNARVAGEMER